jgi:transketolase
MLTWMLSESALAVEATALRRDIVEALYAAGGGHYGGALSVLDVLLTLYRTQLRVNPGSPTDAMRDRLVFSKGHAAIALYAVLRRMGYFTHPLSSYAQTGSPLEGHPDMTALPGVDFSTGSLGMGLSVGLGMAFALGAHNRRVWVVLGDGECQEGQVWEAAMLATRYRVDNLNAVIDANGYQECGWNNAPNSDPCPVPELAAKWRAFGWVVFDVDGHDHTALTCVLREAAGIRAPSVVIARTTKGRGFPLLESDPGRFHCATLTSAEHTQMLASIDDPEARRLLRS